MKSRLGRALPVAALLAVSIAAPAAAAVIDGTSGPDVLVGTANEETMRGFGGADKIYGKGGADRIYGGHDSKKDLLYGGPGNDVIYARFGDRVYAGRGNDVVRVRGAAWKWTIVNCGPGYDRITGNNPWLVGWSGCEKSAY